MYLQRAINNTSTVLKKSRGRNRLCLCLSLVCKVQYRGGMNCLSGKKHGYILYSVCTLGIELTMENGSEVELHLALSASTLNHPTLGSVVLLAAQGQNASASVSVWTSMHVFKFLMCKYVSYEAILSVTQVGRING